MTSRPISDDQLEALVRGALEREAEGIDPRPRLARLERALAENAPPRRRSWRRLGAWGLGTAAALLLAFLLGQHSGPAQASPQELIQEARKTYQLPLDRCYLIEIRKETELPGEANPLGSEVKVHRLWTRGDRFWIESANPKLRWAWGQDERGSVWLAFGPHRAVRLDRDEVPRWLSWNCELLSFRPQKLLDDVLRDFDLRREVAGDNLASLTQTVSATLKAGHWHPTVRAARLELDAETKVVRKLVVERTRLGQFVATVTYTLIETQTQEDAKYALEGHLTAPYEIYARDHQPEKRVELLTRWYGSQAAEWFKLK